VRSSAFGQSDVRYTGGDIEGAGAVGFPDFLILSANFGKTSAALSSVPEPSSQLLLLSALGLVTLVRTRRGRAVETT